MARVLPSSRARALACAVCVTGAACATCGCGDAESLAPTPIAAGRVGASIAVLGGGDVAVVDPDQGSVSILDPDTLAPILTLPVGDEPRALLELPSGLVLVSLHRSGEVVTVDPQSGIVVTRASVCAGPFGLATSPDGASALVACEGEGTVLRLDPDTLSATPIAAGLSRPRAVAALANDVWVADFTGGLLHRIDTGDETPGDGTPTTVSLVPLAAPYRPALTEMTANLAAALLPAFGRLHVAHELVNHTGDTSAEKVAEDYGSVADGNPKINPSVSSLDPTSGLPLTEADPPALYAVYDGGPRAFNGPTALASFGDRYLLVADLSTADVAVLDTTAATPGARAVASFSVGAGPSGIAVDPAGRHAYVDNALDGSVSRLDLDVAFSPTAPVYPAALTAVLPLPAVYSYEALAGRRFFHDATNPHVTPSAVVACSTCHPGGTDDGLVWFIHTSEIPLKRRRTPHLANAHTPTAPFHWNGQFPTMSDLVEATITELMAGDGLLVDPDAVSAYIDEIVLPPPPPAPSAAEAASIARGRAVFTSSAAGCVPCHGGPDFTDNGFHAVLDPMSLHADDVFTLANTPALHGLFLRAPYFHDGRAASLREVLTGAEEAQHGGARALSPGELEDLIAYLGSL